MKIFYKSIVYTYLFLLFILFFGYFIRIFSKIVLVNNLNINGKTLQIVADYTWGDWIELFGRVESDNNNISNEEIKLIYDEMANVVSDTVDEETSNSLLKKINYRIQNIESDIEKYCNSKYIFYKPLKSVSDAWDNLWGWEIVYARNQNDEFPLKTGYVWKANVLGDVEKKVERLVRLNYAAHSVGADNLYVQIPSRIDMEKKQVPFGATDNTNETTDLLLETLGEAGVDTFDLRREFWRMGWDVEDGYYINDSHWNTNSGFKAAGVIASYLNDNYGYDFDNKYFLIDNYSINEYSLNNINLSEKVSIFMPNFDTNFVFDDYMREYERRGEFYNSCMDLSMARTDFRLGILDVYSVSRIRNTRLGEIRNLDKVNNNKKILFSINSFSWHIVPYIAMDVSDVYTTTSTIEEQEYLIKKIEPDMVITIDY